MIAQCKGLPPREGSLVFGKAIKMKEGLDCSLDPTGAALSPDHPSFSWIKTRKEANPAGVEGEEGFESRRVSNQSYLDREL